MPTEVSEPAPGPQTSGDQIAKVPIPKEPETPVAEDHLQAKLDWGSENKTVILNLGRYGSQASLELVRLDRGSYTQGKGGNVTRTISIQEPFYIGVTEVVQKAFHMVMANETNRKESSSGLPMGGLSWKNAHDFCSKLNETLADPHFVVRLPWAFEWEYGASQLPKITA